MPSMDADFAQDCRDCKHFQHALALLTTLDVIWL